MLMGINVLRALFTLCSVYSIYVHKTFQIKIRIAIYILYHDYMSFELLKLLRFIYKSQNNFCIFLGFTLCQSFCISHTKLYRCFMIQSNFCSFRISSMEGMKTQLRCLFPLILMSLEGFQEH